jgi:hypothetical protein
VALEATGVDFRDRWKATAGKKKAGGGQRFFAAVILFTAALLGVALAAGLILGPLFTWQTACITLVVDEYPLGVLEPVPFGAEDSEALRQTLSGSLSSRLGEEPLNLVGFDSVQGIRDMLLPRMRSLDVRGKDVLLAYIRGQSFVAPPLFGDTGLELASSVTGVPCLLARDCRLSSGRPSEVVPIRSVVEAVGASPARVTLVALDLGDLQWDPRLGVLGSVVPMALDAEFAKPQTKATSDNWVLGSHDLFQISAVSIQSKRTCFGRAFELALSGEADRGEYGNNNGLIELDEVAKFVSLWTNEWTRRISGGRGRQTPVIWKLGVGRVAIKDIPSGIALLRVPSKRAEAITTLEKQGSPAAAVDQPPETKASGDPSTTPPSPEGGTDAAPALPPSAVLVDQAVRVVAAADEPGSVTLAFPGEAPAPQGEGRAEDGPPQAKADAPATENGVAQNSPLQEAATTSPPTTEPAGDTSTAAKGADAEAKKPPAPPPPKNVWEALAVLGQRKLEPSIVDGAPAILPVPNDYASPWWRSTFALVASAQSRAASKGGLGERGQATLSSLTKTLSDMAVAPLDAAAVKGESTVAEDLWAARAAASAAGYFQLWSAAPDAFCRAVVARNEALATAVSAIDIIGHASGGVGMPPLDPATLVALSVKIGQLNDMLAAGADSVGIGRLTSAARGISSQQNVVADQLERLVEALHRDDGEAWSPVVSRSLAALRSPTLSAAARQRILEQTFGERAPVAASQLMPIGRPVGVLSREPQQIDPVVLERVAQLTECIPAVVEAALRSGDRSGLGNDIAAVRRELATLSSGTQDSGQALERLVRLGGRVSRLLARVGAVAASESAVPSPRGLLSDREAAIFRVMDVRDIAKLEPAAITGLPDWSAQGTFGLSLEPVTSGSLVIGTTSSVRLAVDSGGVLPADTQVRFVFDPASLELRLPGGEPVTAQFPVPVEMLSMERGELVLEALPRRYAARPDEAVSLDVIWESPQQVAVAKTMLPLPANRDITLAVRSAPDQAWSWSRSAAADDGDDFRQAEVALQMLPGSLTTWELSLANRAEIPRELSLSLYSVEDRSSSAAGVTLGRDVRWQRFAEQVARGESVGSALAKIETLALPTGDTLVPVVFPPEPPSPPGQGPPVAGQPTPAEAAASSSIGPDLALVVQEQTKGQPSRKWLFRLRCEQLHPRGLLDAVAVWSEATATINVTFTLGEAWKESVSIPADGIRVRMEPLLGDTGRSVQVRRSETVLTRDRRSDTLVASWGGGDQSQPPLLAVHINEYPRAFVFAVDCEPSVDGQPQAPKRDWRMLRILEPVNGLTVLKAPSASLPLRLQIDAPPDAGGNSSDASPLASLSMREVLPGTLAKQPQRVVWVSESDRAITYRLEKAEPPVGIAVASTAADWQLEVPGAGFVDVDVEAEVQLVIPGNQPPLSTARQFVFDGRPPVVEVPPSMNVEVGVPLVIPVQVSDDPREAFAGLAGRHLPGVSGVDKVEWALDMKGDGKPEEWKQAVSIGGVLYEIRVETKSLPVGARIPLLVRATDRTGLSAPPSRAWLLTAAEPAKGRIEGRVLLDGRGEANVPVMVTGPGTPAAVKSGKDGSFLITGLEAGDYELKASGVIRNVTHASEPQKVKVDLPPAPPVSVTIELK